VVVDKSAIRAVIEEFDQFGSRRNVLFGTNSGGASAGSQCADGEIIKLDKSAYEGLDKDGTPVVMQLEVNKSKQIKAKEGGGGGKGGTVKPAAGAGAKKNGKKK